MGWRTRADLDAYGKADDSFHITTDADGWRGHRTLDEAEVLVFGDSFAFGHGVDDRDMYTERAEGMTVKAMGSNGYSMVHAVLWMERLRQHLAGRTVVWFVYPGNDLYDNLRPNYGRYRMPYVRLRDGGWEIYAEHVSPKPWPIPDEAPAYLDVLARLSCPGIESARALDAAGYLIRRARQVVPDSAAAFLVISVPRREQLDPLRLPDFARRAPATADFDPLYVDRELGRRCEELEVPFLALADHLDADDYQDRDIHWTPEGHRKVGSILAQLHRDASALIG